MVITAHYISDSCTLEIRVIRFFFLWGHFVVLVFRFSSKLINFLLSLANHIYVFFFRFIRMPSPHDKYSLSKILLEYLSDWNINLKLSTIIVDNASHNNGMMKLVSDKFQASSLILGEKLLHVSCATYILNLVVQEGLNIIGDGIEKVQSNVYFWTQSPKRTEIYEKISRQSHIASTK